MSLTHVGGAVAAVLLMTSGLAAAEINSPEPRAITVRIYNNFGVKADDLQVARAQAEALLRDAGIKVAWMDCWFRKQAPADAPKACRQAPGGNDLVLRLQGNTPDAKTQFVSMGFSLVGGQDTAFLSTVFVNLVWGVAHGAGVDPRPLLGLAIAHELGHLLLNTNDHAQAGLMRADWSRTDIRRHVASDWRILDADAETMREAIAMRANTKANLSGN